MNEEKNINEISMLVILNAGNARNSANRAMTEFKNKNYEETNRLLNEARENLRKAHVAQTEVIQDEARGAIYEPSLLFTHAQDTLMTIMSEVNIYENIVMLLADE